MLPWVAVPAHADPVTALVPAYFYPAGSTNLGYWSQLDTAAQSIPLTAIMNQDSGVVTSLNTDYLAVTQSLVASGGQVIGYLNTNRGAFDLATLETYADNYAKFYPVSGFFLDLMSFSAADLPQYQALYNYLHTNHPGFTVIGNPGVAFDYLDPTFSLSKYLNDNGQKAADTLTVFEGPYHDDNIYNASYDRFPNQFPYTQYDLSWFQTSSSRQLGNIVYATDAATFPTAFAKAVDPALANAGYVYFTDETVNSYSTLPSYWDQEVAAIAALNAVPEPSTLLIVVGACACALAARVASRHCRRSAGVGLR
jgi:hypothetical protein